MVLFMRRIMETAHVSVATETIDLSSEIWKIRIILSGVNENVRNMLSKSNMDKKIGRKNICRDIHEALVRAANKLKENNKSAAEKLHL